MAYTNNTRNQILSPTRLTLYTNNTLLLHCDWKTYLETTKPQIDKRVEGTSSPENK